MVELTLTRALPVLIGLVYYGCWSSAKAACDMVARIDFVWSSYTFGFYFYLLSNSEADTSFLFSLLRTISDIECTGGLKGSFSYLVYSTSLNNGFYFI